MRNKGLRYSCVIFDCDGTLVDTLEDIAAAMNQALINNGFPPVPPEDYPAKVGWGIVKLAAAVLPEDARADETIQKTAADASRIYHEQPLVKSRPYPGMVELAAELRALKVKTAVLSNKPDPVLRLVIDGLFAPGAFDAIRGERPGEPRKPDPSPVWELLVALDRGCGDTIFAGDSEIDLETAKNAGCCPLGVSWGFRSRPTLEAAGAARIVDTPGEILRFVTEKS